MKYRILFSTLLLSAMLCCGCSSSAGSAASGTSAAGTMMAETTVEEAESTAAETTVKETESTAAETTVEAAEEESYPPCELEDGTYTASFRSDSSMFHVNETCDGKGILTVKDGQMTIHISLASKKITVLYRGTKDQALADEAGWILPTTDEVTYSDGMTEEVFGFDLPVPVLEEEFPCALLGSKDKWYNHMVRVFDAEPAE